MSIDCFMLTPTGRYRVAVRRYRDSSASKCPTHYGYHTVQVPFGVEVLTATPGEIPHDDPHWPTHCACGEAFVDSDHWQVNHHQIYTRTDGGPECTLQDAPAGAMWDCEWWRDRDPPLKPGDLFCGPDGLTLCIVLPTGEQWMPDGPAKGDTAGRPGWTRTGAVPRITCSPSILTPRWHGHLIYGRLVPC